MADIQLETANKSGLLTGINIGGTDADNEVLIRSAIDVLIAAGIVDSKQYTDLKFGNLVINDRKLSLQNLLDEETSIAFNNTSFKINVTDLLTPFDYSSFEAVKNEGCSISSRILGINLSLFVKSGIGIWATGLTNEMIDNKVDSLVTKEWVNDKVSGATGIFTTNDGKTVTVTNGLITEIL